MCMCVLARDFRKESALFLHLVLCCQSFVAGFLMEAKRDRLACAGLGACEIALDGVNEYATFH